MGRISNAMLSLAAAWPLMTMTLAGDALGEEGTGPAAPGELTALAEYVAERCDFDAAMWCKIEPNVTFDEVAWTGEVRGSFRGTPPRKIFGSFSGAGFDGRRIYVYGGGHASYEGNEVYAFDLATLEWARLSDPEPLTNVLFSENCMWPDEPGMAAGHAYDTFVVEGNRIHVWPTFFACGASGSKGTAYGVFDIEQGRWIERAVNNELIDELGYPRGVSVAVPGPDDGYALAVGQNRKPLVFKIDLSTGEAVEIGPAGSESWQQFGSGTSVDGVMYLIQPEGLWRVTMDGWGLLEKPLPGLLGPDDGIAYDGERFVFWASRSSGRTVYATEDFETWQTFTPEDGPEPFGPLFDRFFYIESLGVFFAARVSDDLWVLKMPDDDAAFNGRAELEAEGITCSEEIAGWSCPNLQELVDRGGTVELPKGDYAQCVTIREPIVLEGNGSIIRDRACGGKGALIVNADSTIRNIECFGISVRSGNGACIRQQTPNLTLESVHFHDSQEGVLTNGDVQSLTIRDSVFERLGGARGIKLGRAHGVYYSSPRGELRIEGSTFRLPKDEGHLVKSGAARTVILDSTLDERGGDGSRLIDAFNGGEVIVRGSKLLNARHGNSDLIGYDYEARIDHPVNRIVLDNVEADCAGGRLVAGRNSLADAERVENGTALTGCR